MRSQIIIQKSARASTWHCFWRKAENSNEFLTHPEVNEHVNEKSNNQSEIKPGPQLGIKKAEN